MSAHLDGVPEDKPIEIWFQDEARIGQKNGLVRQWARRGTRPFNPPINAIQNAYLFGAICPARGTGAALALPNADTEAMQLHLNEISRHVANGAHAVLLMDRAGSYHQRSQRPRKHHADIPALPRAGAEPRGEIWRYLRANWLSNRVFETYEAIIDAACEAWNKLIALPDTISSIGTRAWAHVGRSQ